MLTPETGIQLELQQTRAFTSRAEASVVSLLRTAELLRQALATLLARHGLLLNEYNILRILRGAGQQGCNAEQVSERMIEQTPVTTRLLTKLAKRGLITREGSGRDAVWRITADGSSFLKQLDAPVRAIDENVIASLSLRDQAALLDLLDRARNGIHRFLAGGRS